MKISFHFQQTITLKQRKQLRVFLVEICKRENKRLESFSVVFCSDEELLQINRTYLKHDYYTDIISFDLSEKKEGAIEGEIYISVDRVRENASNFGSALNMELHRVIFHGLLHFCGYKDKTKAQQSKMRDKEDYYLGLYFG